MLQKLWKIVIFYDFLPNSRDFRPLYIPHKKTPIFGDGSLIDIIEA